MKPKPERRLHHGSAVRLLTEAEGYVMARHHGAVPFVISRKQWDALPPAPPDPKDVTFNPARGR